MSTQPSHDVTLLLKAWSDGDQAALNELEPLVHAELRRIADGYLRRERDHCELQPTELINEAFARLLPADQVAWESRTHFYGVAASLMRRILVDRARRRDALKRPPAGQMMELEETLPLGPEKDRLLLALDDALQGLEKLSARQSRVVELHFFGGLTFEEIGSLMEIAPVTAMREWRSEKAWLSREINRT
jgi:RNA polymerase sigma factor (TIGR02999 family)